MLPSKRAQDHQNRSSDSKDMIILILLFLSDYWGPDISNIRTRIIRPPGLFVSRKPLGTDYPPPGLSGSYFGRIIRPGMSQRLYFEGRAGLSGLGGPQRSYFIGEAIKSPLPPPLGLVGSFPNLSTPLLTFIACPTSLFLLCFLNLFEGKVRGALDPHIHQ